MDAREIADRIEAFIRSEFKVSESDSSFDRQTDLFDRGYVDSVGVTEMLAFLHEQYAVEPSEDDLFSEQFSNIDGIAEIVARLVRERSAQPA